VDRSRTNPSRAAAAGCAVLLALAAGGEAPDEAPALGLVRTIPLKGVAGRYDHMALDAKGSRLFIANLSNNSLDVVDLRAGALVKQIPGQGKIQGVAYAPDLDRVFAGCGTDGVCNVFDGRTYALLHSLKIPDADNVRYNPINRRVYVVNGEHGLTVFDADTYAAKGTVKLPGPAEGFQLDPGRGRLYVNTLEPCEVVEVDTGRNAVVARHPLAGARRNYPLALDAAGRRVFVGCREKPAVVVLDAATGKQLAAVGIPGDVDDLFFDPRRNRVYATCGEGFVAVVRQAGGGRYELAEKVPTGKLARTGFFDPEGGRLYVVVPRLNGGGEPRLQEYRARP
jgi:DNA-binding beta-propeller fold protein YncE